ncbi:MAG: hypothetical protein AAFR59_20400, partial [Bacteroidota bacterium]
QVLYPTPDTRNYRVSIHQSAYREEVSLKARALPSRMSHWILELDRPAERYYAAATPSNQRTSRSQAPTGPQYHLVIFSTESYKEALSIKDAYAREYRDVQILPKSSNGYYRVSLYQSENQSRLTQIARARGRQGKKEGWILTPDMQDPSSTSQNQRLAAPSQAEYHLIFGSFADLNQALRRRDVLRASGYPNATIIYPSPTSNRYRISVYSSKNPYWVENLKKQFFSQEAWILKTSPTDSSDLATN